MKKLLSSLGLVVLCFLILDFQYLSKNLSYYFHKTLANPIAEEISRTVIEPNLLIVEALAIRVPIQYVAVVDENKFQQALANGVVHYPGTAQVGEVGNAYIFGHSSDFPWKAGSYKTVFATLPKIKLGDQIVVSDRIGKKFIYEVKEAKIVSKDDLSVLDQRDYEKSWLTLQTSWPVGTALKRFVAVAELVKQ